VTMHGHRHIDWIGECGNVRIVSAPSPVMEATDSETTCFYIHTLAAGSGGKLCLLTPERINIVGPRPEREGDPRHRGRRRFHASTDH